MTDLRKSASERQHDALVQHHRQLDDLFDRLLARFHDGDHDAVSAMWTDFEGGVLAHLKAEEADLFPRYRQRHEQEMKTLLQEHERIRAVLTELGVGLDLRLLRADLAEEFVQCLRAHAEHEEQHFYLWLNEPAQESLVQIALRKLGLH